MNTRRLTQAEQWTHARSCLGLLALYATGDARMLMLVGAAAMTLRAWTLRRRGL